VLVGEPWSSALKDPNSPAENERANTMSGDLHVQTARVSARQTTKWCMPISLVYVPLMGQRSNRRRSLDLPLRSRRKSRDFALAYRTKETSLGTETSAGVDPDSRTIRLPCCARPWPHAAPQNARARARFCPPHLGSSWFSCGSVWGSTTDNVVERHHAHKKWRAPHCQSAMWRTMWDRPERR
jgi:hypothetical protein